MINNGHDGDDDDDDNNNNNTCFVRWHYGGVHSKAAFPFLANLRVPSYKVSEKLMT